jgi:hypothetical protein
MESIDPQRIGESIDARRFLKGADRRRRAGGRRRWRSAAAADTGRRLELPAERPRPTRHGPAQAGSPVRPNILVIVVDQLRFPQWFSDRARAAEPAAQPRRLRQGAVSFARHYTASNDCTPGALGAADRPVHAPDGLHDHRRQHARPRLPDVGDDAARARLPHLRGTASGTSPTATTTGRPRRANGARALRLRRAAPTPRPTARPARAGAWTRTSPASSRTGSPRRAARSRGARPSRSSTRTTSPGGTSGATASRRGAGAGARPALPPNFETPELLLERHKPRLQRSFQDTRRPRSGRCPSRARKRSHHGCRSSTSTSSSSSRSTATSATSCARWRAARGRGQHGDRVHLRPRRVRRLARAARQGRGAYEEGIRVPLLVKDPRGVLTARARTRARRS